MGRFSRLGNDLYSGRRSIDFVGRRHVWYAASGVIIIAAVLGLYFRGLNFGIEFVGGAQYTVSMPSGEATQSNADSLAAQAATGDLKDVHDYMIASNEASLATEMVVTIKNKAVEAFNEIMRMPV